MPTQSVKAGAVTLLDIARATDPQGRIASIAELLTQSNEILLDMPWIEGNLATGHKGSIRTGLPEPIWRKLYQGVPPTKSLRATVEDSCGMLEDRSEIDVDVASLNGNSNEFRLGEAVAHVEGMNQTMAEALIYGDATLNPERFNGLAQRYASLTGTIGTQNVISGGGSGNDQTSVWLVGWGKNTVHGIYPKGSQAGLVHRDLGEIDAFDANNNRYRALAELFQWKCGLHVKDWRYVVRIANIDTVDLAAVSGTQATTAATFLPRLMIKALARIPNRGMANCAFYANRSVKEMLGIMAMEKNQSVLSIQAAAQEFGSIAPGSVEQGGLRFLGVPIRTVDRIDNTEATLT
jgi:hypothetical protein